MTNEIGGARPAVNRPAASTRVVDLEDFERLIALFCEQRAADRAGKRLSDGAYRILRNRLVAQILGLDPEGPFDWADNTCCLDAWGVGYNAGWKQGYVDGLPDGFHKGGDFILGPRKAATDD